MEDLTRYESQGMELTKKPQEVLEQAKEAAKALQGVISAKPKKVIINNEQYLEFEDWQTVGRFYGVTAKVVSTSLVDIGGVQGFEARAVVLRNSDGMELSAADAMCLNDENNWKSRPLFMLRSMAQTRACAKALRNVLAWVVVLAGYRPTPAEEMEGVEKNKPSLIISEILRAEPIQYVSKKTGKNGMFYKIFVHDHDGNETALSTFSDTLFAQAEKEKGTGVRFKAEWKPGKFEGSKELISLEMIEPEPGAEEQ